MRKALEGIVSILGPLGRDAIVSELRSKCDYSQDYLDAATVRDTLQQLFGPDSADLLLEQVTKVEIRYATRITGMKSAES